MKDVREQIAELMAEAQILVVVDTVVPGVVLPDGVISPDGRHVGISLSWRFEREAQISLDDDAIRANLTFSGMRVPVVLPYAAIRRIDRGDERHAPAALPRPRPTLRRV